MTVPHHHQDDQETILVTGGAGFIGSHTVLQLLDLGKRLVIVDNLCNSSEESLVRAQDLAKNPKGSLIFHQIDLLDGPALEQVFESYTFSACIHFAGLKAVGESSQIPLGYYQTNVTGTLNLVQLLQKYNCRNLIFSSSATVYGLPPSDAPIREDAPTGAMNPYGRTKQYIEEILRDTADSEPGQWNIILLRYFNPVGAHESGRMGEDPNGTPNNLMPFVSQVAIGRRPVINVFGNDYNTKDGTGVRDYIHILDLARGHVAALEKIEKMTSAQKTLGCVPYNLGTGTGYSVMEMIESMSKAVGHALPYKVIGRRPGDVATVIADPSLAAQELNWKAEKSLTDMCVDLWRWQTMNPDGYKQPECTSSTPSSQQQTNLLSPQTPLPAPHSYMTLPTVVSSPSSTKEMDSRTMTPIPTKSFSPASSPTPAIKSSTATRLSAF
ncbi:UDP-glucose 4-epimerase Uge1 [Gryganskiella cystojenkinii]|nr:UDP-glucose 4-epimerase Uge1 [Gryganskiella cystojenkinii]